LLRGLLANRLVRGPRAEIDDRRLFVRTTIFRSRAVAWADVLGLTRTSRGIALQLAGGRTVTFNLSDATNRDHVEQAIVARWQAIEAARIPPPPPPPPSPPPAPPASETTTSIAQTR
jgi:hypothetical protein